MSVDCCGATYVQFSLVFFFFFKKKTAYELRISDWSSDVCSSDLAAVSLMAARGEDTPRSMVMMGGPIDTRKSPTAVNNLATQKPLWWFEQNVIQVVPANYPGRGRSVYPGFLQHAGFMAMNPERHFLSHWDFYQDLVKGDLEDAAGHRRFYDEYNAVLDMPASYYLDTVRIVFQEQLLPRGLWDVDGERVRPSAIKDTALLSIEGELDDISGAGQRSEERRVGKECVSTCRSRWAPYI